MKKLFLFMCAFCLLFAACDKRQEIAYNDSIVESQQVVVDEYIRFNLQLSHAIPTLSFDSIRIQADRSMSVIEQEIAKIDTLQTPENGEKFRESAITLFQSIKELVNAGGEFVVLTEKSPQDSVNMLIEKYNEKSEDYKFKNSEIQKVQQNYAQEKKIQILD